MAAPDVLEPLAAPLAAIQRLIEQFDNRGVIIGGVAASLLGRPRLTADADVLLLLSVNDIPRLLELAGTVGLQPRLANAMEFARRNRVLLLQHVATGIGVDISLGLLPFEVETVERSVEHQVGAVRLRLPTPEDLIILKAIAHRPKDMLDIEAVIAAQEHLDKKRIASWVRQFADLLEVPELWTDLERLLRKSRS